jgi:FkbM family methyltransferase
MNRVRESITLPARLWTYLRRRDGIALGWWLARELPDVERRRLAVSLLRSDAVVLEFEADGFSWRVPAGDEITRELLATGNYGGKEATALGHWVRSRFPERAGLTVVEVGANVGTTTLPLARDGWRVVACEPVPSTFRFLEANVTANEVTVTCMQRAVGGSDGQVMMAPSSAHGSSRVSAAGSVPASMSTLESLLLDLGVPVADVAFVWCDAEGSEAGVIAGGAVLWRAGVPLCVEIEPGDQELVGQVIAHFDWFAPVGDSSFELRPTEAFADWAAALTVQGDLLLVADPVPPEVRVD